MSSTNNGMSYSEDPPTNTNSNDAKKNEVSDQMKHMSYSHPPPEANSSSQKSQTLSTQDSMSYSNYK
ncbi:hypothetical protein MtrunA17_Chr2g0297641 [Medicago truncatula]|uniref:Uncharacterized protein n=1 Tax=Medicago truncatula TaxID=3880 RepID=A0A072VH01_MEDTR|nr:hypothetical protein MTR_2g438630 [Medicago truncatula]RHN73364.1 hypothetical protein MtrunA17_Chr2g0297641 [Medicago truncatula]